MSRDLSKRITALEQRQSLKPMSKVPVYTVLRDGDPLPAVDGPIYRLVAKSA